MPHKRNPELCERVCGLTRVLRSNALASFENMALWHERDISHSSVERIILPDSCLALDYILNIFTSVVAELKVDADRMRTNVELTHGLVFSQRVLLLLIDKGLSRQEAYEVVQSCAMDSWRSGIPFYDLVSQDPRVLAMIKPAEVAKAFDYDTFLKEVDHIFERAEIAGDTGPLSPGTQTLAPRSY